MVEVGENDSWHENGIEEPPDVSITHTNTEYNSEIVKEGERCSDGRCKGKDEASDNDQLGSRFVTMLLDMKRGKRQ